MARARSTTVEQILKEIEILKKAHQSWPEGVAHPLIAEGLKKAEEDFKEELYQEEKKRNTPGEGTRRSNSKKE